MNEYELPADQITTADGSPIEPGKPVYLKAGIYRLLPCPKCGRQWSPDVAEAAACRCCGEDLPTLPLVPAK